MTDPVVVRTDNGQKGRMMEYRSLVPDLLHLFGHIISFSLMEFLDPVPSVLVVLLEPPKPLHEGFAPFAAIAFLAGRDGCLSSLGFRDQMPFLYLPGTSAVYTFLLFRHENSSVLVCCNPVN